jgi:hypothetical protein
VTLHLFASLLLYACAAFSRYVIMHTTGGVHDGFKDTQQESTEHCSSFIWRGTVTSRHFDYKGLEFLSFFLLASKPFLICT